MMTVELFFSLKKTDEQKWLIDEDCHDRGLVTGP
jgi:hypothetical protein